MAHNPISRDPVRVPAEYVPFLRFGWPGGADPLGMIGQSSPVTSFSAAAKRYCAAASNSPLGANEAFTVTAVITISATLPTGTQFIASTTSGTQAGGFALFRVLTALSFNTFDAAGNQTALAGAPDFSVGQTHTLIGVHNPRSYAALFIDGALVDSSATTRSWTTQSTLNLGWSGTTNTWSGGLRDVYLFGKAMTKEEVWILHRELRLAG